MVNPVIVKILMMADSVMQDPKYGGATNNVI
jgi:hypothetical protein